MPATTTRDALVSVPPPLVFNAATVPVSVLDKTLALRADQKAEITDLQNALQAKRQAVFALQAASAQSAVVGADNGQHPAVAANIATPANDVNNGVNAGGASERNGVWAQLVTVSAATSETAAQVERETFLRLQAAEQALARDEQATVRKVRALLTMEQISQLKTTESDAALFDAVGLPVELLGQIALTPAERATITTIFKTARRQFQRATRQIDRDAVQNDARAQSLAALSSQNQSVANAFLKAQLAAQAAPAAETQK